MQSDEVIRTNQQIGARIAKRRKELGLTQTELGERVGYKSSSKKSTIQKIEAGHNGLRQSMIIRFADALETTISYLMGWEDPVDVTDDTVRFPIIGEIGAGYDKAGYEDYDGEIEIPRAWLKGRQPTDYFVLRVTGDSMYPAYQDGDLILVLRQTTLNHSGQVGVVMYEDENATLKKVEYVYGEDWMKLIPINPSFPPIMVRDEALEHCRVLGYPVKLIRDVI